MEGVGGGRRWVGEVRRGWRGLEGVGGGLEGLEGLERLEEVGGGWRG